MMVVHIQQSQWRLILTLKGALAALVGALAARCRHGHDVPFDVEQKIA